MDSNLLFISWVISIRPEDEYESKLCLPPYFATRLGKIALGESCYAATVFAQQWQLLNHISNASTIRYLLGYRRFTKSINIFKGNF